MLTRSSVACIVVSCALSAAAAPGASAAVAPFTLDDPTNDVRVPGHGNGGIPARDPDLVQVRLSKDPYYGAGGFLYTDQPAQEAWRLEYTTRKTVLDERSAAPIVVLSDVDADGTTDYAWSNDGRNSYSSDEGEAGGYGFSYSYSHFTRASVVGGLTCVDTGLRNDSGSSSDPAVIENGFGSTNFVRQDRVAPNTTTVYNAVPDDVAAKVFPEGARISAYSKGYEDVGSDGNVIHKAMFDYAPDSANPVANRSNPRTSNPPQETDRYDFCDFDGDGEHEFDDYLFGPIDGDQYTKPYNNAPRAGFVPIVPEEGLLIGPPSGDGDGTGGGGGGTGGGGTGGGGTGGGTSLPPGNPGDPSSTYPFQTAGSATFSGKKMPKVVGKDVDVAVDTILKAVPGADFDIKEITLPKAPKGVAVGEISAQTPAVGRTLTGSLTAPPKVSLKVYSGPKPTGKNDCLDKVAKAVKGLGAMQAADVLKAAGCRTKLDFVLGGADDTATGVKLSEGDRVTLKARVPKDPEKLDLFMAFRAGGRPADLTFGADDKGLWKLTASKGEPSKVLVQVIDRAGRLVKGVKLVADTTDAGATSDEIGVTNANGEALLDLYALKAGRIDIVAYADTLDGITLYGSAQLQAITRTEEEGKAGFFGIDGRFLKRGRRDGWEAVPPPTTARAAGAFDWFTTAVKWVQGLFTGPQPAAQAAQQAVTEPAKPPYLKIAGLPADVDPSVLALGQPVGGTPPTIATDPNVPLGTVANGVIAVGAGHAVPSGRGNVGTASAPGVIAVGAGHVIAVGAGHVIAVGAGHVIAVGAGHVIAVGAGHVLKDPAGRVIAVGAGHVIAVGAGHVIAVGAGHIAGQVPSVIAVGAGH